MRLDNIEVVALRNKNKEYQKLIKQLVAFTDKVINKPLIDWISWRTIDPIRKILAAAKEHPIQPAEQNKCNCKNYARVCETIDCKNCKFVPKSPCKTCGGRGEVVTGGSDLVAHIKPCPDPCHDKPKEDMKDNLIEQLFGVCQESLLTFNELGVDPEGYATDGIKRRLVSIISATKKQMKGGK